MKVVRCDHGHWYDADSYPKCPHCNPSTGKITSVSDAGKNNIQPPISDGLSFADEKKTENITWDTVIYDDTLEKNVDETVSLFSKNEGDSIDKQDGLKGDILFSTHAEHVSKHKTDLQKELQGVSNSSVQKTMSYFGKVKPDGQSSSSQSIQQTMSTAPVVGWLVCISGPHIGQSFNINAGKNSIGRGPENDIVLSKDPTVSGAKHAWVTYEAKHRNFILQAGDGRYPDLNGEQVIEGKMLKAFDKIELGETSLLFVNLCGDAFAWEDYLNKE